MMRRLFVIALALVLLTIGQATAAPTLYDANFTASNASSTTISTSLASVLSGHAIAVFVANFTPGTTATVSDGTNTYTQLDVASTPYQTTTFVAKNVAAGSYTVTATFSAADIARTIIAIEVAGADTVNPVGSAHKLGSQANPGTGTDAVTSGTVTVQTDSLVIGIVWHDTVAATWNLGTGFTQLFINEPSQNCCGFAAERKTHSGATGSDAATFTDSTDGMNEYRTAIIAFIPAATGGLFRNQGDLSGLGTGGKFRKGLDCRLERGRDYEYGDGVGVPLP